MLKTTRRQTLTFKLPNRLVLDTALSFSARRIGTVLYSRRNHLGACRRSLAGLSKLACCSVATTRTALEELEAGGYLTRSRHYKYNEQLGRMVYDQYTYHCDLSFRDGYTLIPRDLFCHTLKSSAFVVCLYLYLRAGNSTRAFPSLNRICRELWIAKSTVCRALRVLGAAGRIYAQVCIKANHAHSCNSYFFLCNADRPVTASVHQGAPLGADRVSAFCFSYCASRRRKLPSCYRVAPFPCQHYTATRRYIQLISLSGGGFKISKQELKT